MRMATLAPTISSSTWISGNVREMSEGPITHLTMLVTPKSMRKVSINSSALWRTSRPNVTASGPLDGFTESSITWLMVGLPCPVLGERSTRSTRSTRSSRIGGQVFFHTRYTAVSGILVLLVLLELLVLLFVTLLRIRKAPRYARLTHPLSIQCLR